MIEEKQKKLSPLLKYPGGKESELQEILPRIKRNAVNYYEPFVGGGAVYFAVDAEHYFINDLSFELMNMYQMVKDAHPFFINRLLQMQHHWDVMKDVIDNHTAELIDLHYRYKYSIIDKQLLFDSITNFFLRNVNEFNGLLNPEFNVGIDNFVNELIRSFRNKIVRMVEIEKKKGDLNDADVIKNIEAAFKAAFYTHFRYLYNHVDQFHIDDYFATAIYFFIREYCYSSMFRYNSRGQFNVPYGGISYNSKTMSKKIQYFQSRELNNHLNNTTFGNMDFFDFMNINPPGENDFVFLDPPYDTEFSTYALNEFNKNDQLRLANYLKKQCDAYFMIVIKNTEYIQSLYTEGELVKNNRRLHVYSFEKKYFVSFQDRNDKQAKHLLITNYVPGE